MNQIRCTSDLQRLLHKVFRFNGYYVGAAGFRSRLFQMHGHVRKLWEAAMSVNLALVSVSEQVRWKKHGRMRSSDIRKTSTLVHQCDRTGMNESESR